MRLFLATLLTAIGLQAATISYGPVTTSPGFDPGDQTNYLQTLSLSQFNPSLGTLTGVQITVDTQLQKSGSLINTGASATDMDYTYRSAGIAVTGAGVSHIQNASPAFLAGEFFLGVPGNGGSVTIAALQEFSLGNIFNPGSLSLFIGTGTVDYAVNAAANLLTGCGNGNCASNIVTTMGARIGITYTYEPDMNEVPEPASFAMVGLGVLALGLLGRRGRGQKA